MVGIFGASTGELLPIPSMDGKLRSANRIKQFVQCVRSCNRGAERRKEFFPFYVESDVVGYVHPIFADHLRGFPGIFCFKGEALQIHDALKTPKQRTDAVEEALQTLRSKGLIPGWRNEHYPVVLSYDSPAFFSLERAAVPFFGTRAYGVHMNGYVSKDGTKKLWVAKRSKTKQTYPGYLDHLVAGGQPVGLTCKDNLVKECQEEAGIPEMLARKAIPVGGISYEDISGEQYKRDVLFCYDLELPLGFEPTNTGLLLCFSEYSLVLFSDGEVENFVLESIPDVIDKIQHYKPNCGLVVIDFLFRHGYLKPEEKGYWELFESLRNLK